jgi:hypothetical protein
MREIVRSKGQIRDSDVSGTPLRGVNFCSRAVLERS